MLSSMPLRPTFSPPLLMSYPSASYLSASSSVIAPM